MPYLGLGTFTGTRFTQKAAPGTMRRAVRAWLALGGRLVDCAQNYLNENEVGDALKDAIADGSVASRDAVWLTTKLNNPYHAPADVRPALEKSLRDLDVASVDLFLMHWPVAFVKVPYGDATTVRGFPDAAYEPDECSGVTGKRWTETHWSKHMETWPPHLRRGVSIHDTYRAMLACRDAGLCAHVGVANFTVALLHELCCVNEPPAVVQCESHPFLQQRGLIRYCEYVDAAFQAYSPLGYGVFRGATEPAPLTDATILAIAEKHGVSPAAVCLRWTYQRGVLTMPMTLHEAEMRDNLGVFRKDGFTLDDDDLAAIARLDRGHHYLRPDDWYGLPLWD